MKKKHLKSLQLNKKSISNMNLIDKVVGGSFRNCYPEPVDPDLEDDTSERGCDSTPDATMTCPNWSCTCPQN